MWDTVSQIVTKAFRSKTLIVGWLTVIAGAMGFVAGHDFMVQYPEVVSVLVAVVGALNMVLRTVTFLPLDVKSKINE